MSRKHAVDTMASAPPTPPEPIAVDRALQPIAEDRALQPIAEDREEAPQADAISPFCHEVIDLFTDALADVRFPDVDRSPELGLARLRAEAAAVDRAQLEVETLERSLDEARERLREAGATLSSTAGRALAYARVFASGSPELGARIEAIRSPTSPVRAERARAERSAAVVQPGRRRRARDSQTAELPMASADSAAGTTEAAAE